MKIRAASRGVMSRATPKRLNRDPRSDAQPASHSQALLAGPENPLRNRLEIA